MTLTHSFEIQTLLFVWFIAFSLFIFVEFLEILRGISRIKMYGIVEGIFNYHISQWSRNFTFGMLYYFTFNLIHYGDRNTDLNFQIAIMKALGWIVVILLIVEIVLWIPSKNNKCKSAHF